MTLSVIQGDVEFQGTVSFGGDVGLPAGTVDDTAFSSTSGDRLTYEKQEHYRQIVYTQDGGTDIVTQTRLVYLAKGAGEVTHVWIRPATSPSGGDKQYTVDVKKAADGSSSFTSILSAAVTISSADTSNTQQAATVTTSTMSAKDCLEIVITASGSTGSQGQGLIVVIGIAEQPS